jgi:hypothetical protein
MSRLSPPEVDVPASAPGDPRFGHLLGSALREDEPPQAIIVGFPCDEGVRRREVPRRGFGRCGGAESPLRPRRPDGPAGGTHGVVAHARSGRQGLDETPCARRARSAL